MEYRHTPVLLAEVLSYLEPKKGGTFVDCTLGGAGHAGAILEKIAPDGRLIALDQDIEAIDAAKVKLSGFSQQVKLIKGNFRDLDEILEGLGIGLVDGFLFDLGVSAYQLEEPTRGFSYSYDGLLDMRMDKSAPLTAEMVVNTYSKKELTRVIREYGEEKWAARIADFIVKARRRKKIRTTFELVKIIKDAIPAEYRRKGKHPAKKTFQALRIEVNKELEALEKGIRDAVSWLKRGGRIVVISYHSLEDRIVKKIFKELEKGCICPPEFLVCRCGKVRQLKILTKKAVKPSEEELAKNPRARSARLRAAEKV